MRCIPAWLTLLGESFAVLEAEEQSRFLRHWIGGLDTRGRRLIGATQESDREALDRALSGLRSRADSARSRCVPGAQPLPGAFIVDLALDNRGIPAFENLLITITRSAADSIGLRVS